MSWPASPASRSDPSWPHYLPRLKAPWLLMQRTRGATNSELYVSVGSRVMLCCEQRARQGREATQGLLFAPRPCPCCPSPASSVVTPLQGEPPAPGMLQTADTQAAGACEQAFLPRHRLRCNARMTNRTLDIAVCLEKPYSADRRTEATPWSATNRAGQRRSAGEPCVICYRKFQNRQMKGAVPVRGGCPGGLWGA